MRDVTVAFPEGPDLPSFRVLSPAAEAALKGPTNRISKIIAVSVWANLPDINETLVRAIRIPGLDAAVEAARSLVSKSHAPTRTNRAGTAGPRR